MDKTVSEPIMPVEVPAGVDSKGDLINFLANLQPRLQLAQDAHYANASSASRVHGCLGITNIVLTSLTAAFLFATVEQVFQRVLAALALISAAIASIQSFTRLPEKGQRHGAAGVEFGILGREIDFLLANSTSTSYDQMRDGAERIVRRWNEITKEAPMVNKNIWESCRKRLKEP